MEKRNDDAYLVTGNIKLFLNGILSLLLRK